jgi:hypothetical protein
VLIKHPLSDYSDKCVPYCGFHFSAFCLMKHFQADTKLITLLWDTSLLAEPKAFLKSVTITVLNKLHVS